MASQMKPPASPHPTFVADLEIALCQATLTAKIEVVQLDMGIMRQDVDKRRSRVTETQQRVSLAADTVAEHSSALCSLQTKLKALEYKVDDAENHSRRNNLLIVGLA